MEAVENSGEFCGGSGEFWRILWRQWRIPEMGKSGRNREKVGLLIWREHDR